MGCHRRCSHHNLILANSPGFEVVGNVTTEYILYTIISYAITMFIVGFAYGRWKKVDKGDNGKKEVRAY